MVKKTNPKLILDGHFYMQKCLYTHTLILKAVSVGHRVHMKLLRTLVHERKYLAVVVSSMFSLAVYQI